MKQRVNLIPAPTGIQPGGYVPVAYAERNTARTPQADIAVEASGQGWTITLSWACPEAVRSIANETDKFIDACAILAPMTPEAPWMTMGAPGQAVEGFLWRPDRPEPWRIHAEGLGSVQRSTATGAKTQGEWTHGRWQVVFELPEWPALEKHRQVALAVWRGSEQERAGLKSLSPGWLALG